jgi:hypothetical protein
MRCCFWPDMLGDCIVLLLVGCEVVVRGECSSLLCERAVEQIAVVKRRKRMQKMRVATFFSGCEWLCL